MSIRAKAILGFIPALVLILIVVVVLMGTSTAIRRAAATNALATNLMRALLDVSAARNDFSEQPSAETAAVWEAKQQVLKSLLANSGFVDSADLTLLDQIEESTIEAEKQFGELRKLIGPGADLSLDPALRRDLKGEILSRIATHSRKRVDCASQLAEASRTREELIHQLSHRFVIAASLAAALWVLVHSVLVLRTVLRPVTRLQDGVAAVGRGDLNYRVNHPARDEFGELARGFDAMTQNLSESTRDLTESLRRERGQAGLLRGLADTALAVNAARSVEEVLQIVTDRARILIGAHQSVTSFTVNMNWGQAITGLSLSDKYGSFRKYDVPPNGLGIYALVCETNQPLRLTQSELEAHPRWRGFGVEASRHPAMRGWLAAPLAAFNGQNLGLIQLSDRYEGEFTPEDEAVLVQLAQLASAALDARKSHQDLESRVRERTQELSLANQQLEKAHSDLARTASRLALPMRGANDAQRRYRLQEFSLEDMSYCGAAIRGLSEKSSGQEVAEGLVRLLYDRVVDPQGERAFALVRAFETRPFRSLDEVQKRAALALMPDIAEETRCLTLVATAGDDDDWNDIRCSNGHQAIPLSSAEAIARLPMVAQLIRELGLEVSGILEPNHEIMLSGSETGVFHVPNARQSPYIPAQTDFVARHDIKSVVGLGDMLSDGRMFAVIMFSKVSIPRETAVLFGHLSLSVRMALLSKIDAPELAEAQILSLDRLLRNHERIVIEQETRLREAMTSLAASNLELEQFAFVASHDLQEPLRKIQAFGNLLVTRFRDSLGADGQDYLDRMQRASQRMQRLINDLLVLSRITRRGDPLRSVSLAEVVRGVLGDLEARIVECGAQVDVGDLPAVEADPVQMRQLFQNLIGNALKYHAPGQKPHVSIRSKCVGSNGDNGTSKSGWKISIRDDGIGFDPKYSEQIFLPFQRLHAAQQYEGTGMGLAICRRIVDRHRGSIAVHSSPGEGAEFTVTLPLASLPAIEV